MLIGAILNFFMKTVKNVLLTFFFIITLPCLVKAQEQKSISGRVIDAANKDPLPNASISLKNKPVGTIADEEGKFTLYIPVEAPSDTLFISYLGYKNYFIGLQSIKGPMIIEMKSAITELSEVEVRPWPPTYYIKMAMRQIRENYPKEPFQTEAFYLEKVTENNSLLKNNECVFKTYFPNFLDSLKNQHQLLLYRQPGKIEEMKFMEEERKEQEEKEFKKHPNEKKLTGTDFIFRLGGPGTILYFSRISKRNDDFLDSTKFNHFNYSFSESSVYKGKEYMEIDFKSKGKVGYLKKEGKIYIDPATNAIFRIEGSGDFVIPVAYRPLLFLYGFSAHELSFRGEKEYQQINGKWYPKYLHVNFKIDVTKKRWFSPNEHSVFLIEQMYSVHKFSIQNISPIDPGKRFNRDKEMGSQVFKEPGISWP
jgi:hypothetical protein